MKKTLLILLLPFLFMMIAQSQSELIIEEDFYWWDPTEGVDMNPDSCGTYPPSEYKVEREMEILTSDGYEDIPVHMTMVVIKPECPSRRVYDGGGTLPPGVTLGWVQLNKIRDDYNTIETFEFTDDTIGEFVFGPVPQIDSMRIAHSATGSNRGFRIYTSTDGENWDRPTDNEFWDGSDCQAGDSNVVEIFEEDVYIKLTSGFKRSDSTSQYTRIHNIKVWGEPGELQLSNSVRYRDPELKYIGHNRYQLPDQYSEITVFDILGHKAFIKTEENIIDLSPLESGVYIIRARNLQGQMIAKKVLKR